MDPLGAVKTPQKNPEGSSVLSGLILREPISNPENWFVCNQFFPSNCVLTPRRVVQGRNLSSISFNLSPGLKIITVFEEDEDSEEVFDDELDNLEFQEVTTRSFYSPVKCNIYQTTPYLSLLALKFVSLFHQHAAILFFISLNLQNVQQKIGYIQIIKKKKREKNLKYIENKN